MSRFEHAANEAATEKQIVPFRLLAEVGVSSSTLYLHSGAGVLNVEGKDYLGVGQYGACSPVEEETDVFPRPLKLSLNGVSSQYLYEAFTEALYNRRVVIKRAYLVEGAGTLVASCEVAYRGFIDRVDVYYNDAERGNYIELTCEYRLRRESPEAYYTDQDQQVRFPGDVFFNRLGDIEGSTAVWGRHIVRPVETGPGSPWIGDDRRRRGL